MLVRSRRADRALLCSTAPQSASGSIEFNELDPKLAFFCGLRSVFSSSVVTSRHPDVLIGSAVGPSRSSGTRAALFSQVGLDWQLGGGFAVDSSSGSIASMDNSSQVAQLLQATTDGLNAALSVLTQSRQTLLATPPPRRGA